MLAVLQLVDSLRSGLARNAIVCLGDLFQGFPKHMENELDHVIPKLMRRYTESSTFLVKEVDRSLMLMIENVALAKSLAALNNAGKHKHEKVRNRCAFLVANCLEKMVKYINDSI
jgi:hypothetical protein